MTSSVDFLVDSDVFVGLIFSKDPLSASVRKIFQEIRTKHHRLATTNWVIAETATVLSHRDSQQTATAFLKKIAEGEIPVLRITEEVEQETYSIFRKQTTKNTSMVDCSNIAVAKYFQIPNILSFDKFYSKSGYTVQKI